jgi:hypothetical protein
MPRRRAEIVVLSVLAVVAVTVAGWRAAGGVKREPKPAAAPRPAASAPLRPAASTPARGGMRGEAVEQGSVPPVSLGALAEPRPTPLETTRDPFRFKVQRPAGPQVGRGGAPLPRPNAATVDPAAPPPPPPVPPITLKFIGIVQVPDRGLKLAVLSDSRGVYFGREGEIIEGRYRITRIGSESIVVTYLDGTGLRVIPLSGS